MKMALIQDSLLIKGGSERIFLYMIEEFREADIFTLAYNPKNTWTEFAKYKIHTSWANRVIQSHNRFKSLFPISTYIMQYWNFNPYDIILTSSTTVAKYISRVKGKHVCYCYFPTRAIWANETYFGSVADIKSKIFNKLLPFLRNRDYLAAQKVHQFIAISKTSQEAIKYNYNRDAIVLNCPIDVERFRKGSKEVKEDFFLIISRLEKWKRLDYAIEAFNRIGYRLIIIGGGEHESALKGMSNKNIEFLGIVDDETLVKYYGRARAVIFTPELEYGLIPLEANAAGTPVIAFGKGGVQETMIPVNGGFEAQNPTALFFYEQSPEDLIKAIHIFETLEFQPKALIKHADKFGIPSFKKRLREYINDILN